MIPEWLFVIVILAGVIGSILLLVLLVGFFVYEFKNRQIW